MSNENRFDPSLPIFQDPPDDLDENWSGFLIGGMAVTDEFNLARAYKLAGDATVEKASQAGDLSYELAYPILFLYRHAIELYLKLIVRPDNPNHGLTALADQFCILVNQRLNQTVPDWVRKRLGEFSEVDPNSQAFRYARDRQGELPLVRSGEWWVEFGHLRKTMDVLVAGFERVHWAPQRMNT